MGLRTQHDILTPGSKKQLLAKLAELTQYVQDDCDREVIMYWTAALMQPVVNEFAYYDPKKYPKQKPEKKKTVNLVLKRTKRPHRCDGIIFNSRLPHCDRCDGSIES